MDGLKLGFGAPEIGVLLCARELDAIQGDCQMKTVLL